MESNDGTCSLISRTDPTNRGQKNTDHLLGRPSHSCSPRSKEASSSQVFGFESQYRLKRRSGWFWIMICVIASCFALMSSRFLLRVSWAPSFSLNQISSTVLRASTSSKVLPADAKIPEATVLVQKFNRTDQVQFDKYSLILRGQRIFL
jgi:hypothetical protein